MLRQRIRALFRRDAVEAELDDELRFHIDRLAELYVTQGMRPEEARRRAILQFGGIDPVKEDCRESRGVNFVETLLQDLRYALRVLRRSPGFTLVAVASLALGIGANTAIFSMMDSALLKTLPVRDPGRLAQVVSVFDDGRGWYSNVSSRIYEELRRNPHSFSDVFAFTISEQTMRAEGSAERVRVEEVSGNYYAALGVPVQLGRPLMQEDARELPSHVAAVLSYSFWTRRFGRDPSVLGRSVFLADTPVTIVGVTVPEFHGAEPSQPPDIAVPLPVDGPWPQSLNTWARLKPGVTLRQAEPELDVVFQRYLEWLRPEIASWPERNRRALLSERGELRPADRSAGLRVQYEEPLKLVFAISGVVLLIACANVANLLLARVEARASEMGLRLAIGAGRKRLTRQLLTESMLLAAIGAILGLLVAYGCHHVLLSALTQGVVTEAMRFQLDSRVLILTLAVSLLVGLLFGIVPALRAARVDVYAALKREPGRATVPVRNRLAKGLVVVQVAASFVLLVAAGLLARTLKNLNSVDPGFRNPDTLLTMQIDPGAGRREALAGLQEEISRRVQEVPGVRSAALAHNIVFGHGSAWKTVYLPGYEHGSNQSPQCGFNVVGAGFFAACGVPLVEGREFTDRDTLIAPGVVLVNETLARKYWPGESAVGKRMGSSADRTKWEIVGVVKDAKYGNLRSDVPPMMYHALLQWPEPRPMTLHIRTSGDPVQLANRIRSEIAAVDKSLAVFDIKTLKTQVEQTLVRERTIAALAILFGLLALGLTCVGLYGVIAYAAARRTSEIGVRIALGATRAGVIWMILRETLAMLLAGAVFGVPATLVVTRLIRSQLFGLTPSDPATIAGAGIILAVVGAAAGYIPARRAASLDPIGAMRCE